MPASHNPQTGAPAGFADLEAQNKDIAAKLAAQDSSGKSTAPKPEDLQSAGDALDALAAQVKPADTTPAPGAAGTTPDAPAAGAPPEPTAVEKEAAAKAAEEAAAKEATKKKAEDLFKDTPALPQGTSKNASEAFESIKIRAAQDISAKEAELEKIRKELEDTKKKLTEPNPELAAKEQELQSLREFRTKLDVEFDPKFKTFDQGISQAHEFVYAQLRQSPAVTEATIEKIKSLGGPEKVNLSKLFESIKDTTLQRIVESKVADIAQLQYQKDQAIKTTKENVSQYLSERQQQIQQSLTSHTKATESHLNSMLNQLDWFKEKTVDAAKPEAERKSVEDQNKFLTDLKSQIALAMQDDSPQMRAILITGMAQLLNTQRGYAALKVAHEALQKEHTELAKKWENAKQAGVSRLNTSAAPASGVMPAPKPQNQFTTTAVDALDALARQITEQRAAAK